VHVRTIVKGKNYEVPGRVRAYAERKLGRLGRLLDDRSEAIVELSVEQHRSDSHIVDVTLVIDGQPLRSTAAAPTHRAGIDDVLDKIERRAVDFRKRPRARAGTTSAAGPAPEHVTAGAAGRGPADGGARRRRATPPDDETPHQIVKVKRFNIEPMFEEDAVARMEELGHEFFVFVNAENERVAILYRRREGDYGLIEPVLGGGYTKGGPPLRSGPH
jgi:putative sigma-54 modulation protein